MCIKKSNKHVRQIFIPFFLKVRNLLVRIILVNHVKSIFDKTYNCTQRICSCPQPILAKIIFLLKVALVVKLINRLHSQHVSPCLLVDQFVCSLFVCLFVCLCVCVFVCPSVSLSVCLSVYPYVLLFVSLSDLFFLGWLIHLTSVCWPLIVVCCLLNDLLKCL